MNIDNLKSTWQQQTATNDSITINPMVLANIKINKQIHRLHMMKLARLVEGLIFLTLMVMLGQYMASQLTVSAAFVSAFILSGFALTGLIGNIGQLYLISQVDYSKPIKQLQKEVYAICSHKLQLTKLLLLSLPFYMCYVFLGFDLLWGIDLYQHLSQNLVLFYSLSSIALLVISGGFLIKLNENNIDTLWVKHTINFIIGANLIDMARFIHTIDTP